MEKETFEDQKVAEIMNENFVNIKVDREENPDIDAIYITAVQLMTGRAGWPLNVICLPNGKPIYGGTYHTKEQWINSLNQVLKVYKKDPQKLTDYADKVAQGIRETNDIKPYRQETNFKKKFVTNMIEKWKSNWDLTYGGENNYEKFITPVKLNFLMLFQTLTKDPETLQFLQTTLSAISNEGIFDHLEGGVFRYSTDKYWHIPHFEKMLYDNAQMLSLFAKAYGKYKKENYKKALYKIDKYLQKRMSNRKGGYYSAIDADSPDGGEGHYYLWTRTELEKLIGKDLPLFTSYYKIDWEKPWEENFYLLRKINSQEEFSRKHNIEIKELKKLVAHWESKLHKALLKRKLPFIDNKIITSWNALLVKGFCDAYITTEDPYFLNKATETINFIIENCFKDNILYHTYQKNKPGIKGLLEDYAFIIEAAIKLYQTTLNPQYLDLALKLSEIVVQNFKDTGSDFFTYKQDTPLLSKILSVNDGVMPSPNAIMAKNLWTLGQYIKKENYLEISKKMLLNMTPLLEKIPGGYTLWGQLYINHAFPRFEVITVGPDAKAINNTLQKNDLPNVLLQASQTKSDMPLLKNKYVDGQTLIYICQDKVCYLPTTSIDKALKEIKKLRKNFTDPE